MTGLHVAFPPNNEICRGYVVTVDVNRYGHPKIPLFNAMTMSDTENLKVNSCFSCKKKRTKNLRSTETVQPQLLHCSSNCQLLMADSWKYPGRERGLCLTWTDLWLHWKSQNNSLKQVIPAVLLPRLSLSLCCSPREYLLLRAFIPLRILLLLPLYYFYL